GIVPRRSRLAFAIPHDAFGQTEVRKLRIDVRTWPRDDIETSFSSHSYEAGNVETRVALAEVEGPACGLVDAPRYVRVDNAQPHRLHRIEARPPLIRGMPEVVHRSGVERKDLSLVAEKQAVRMDVDG